jgi:putative FmdB family regulatory protein
MSLWHNWQSSGWSANPGPPAEETDVPTYQYACTECDEQLEVRQSFTDDPLTVCPRCEGRLRKIFNAVGVVFKGSGFYKTDSRKAPESASGGSGSKDSGDSGAKDSGSKDSGSKDSGVKDSGSKGSGTSKDTAGGSGGSGKASAA